MPGCLRSPESPEVGRATPSWGCQKHASLPEAEPAAACQGCQECLAIPQGPSWPLTCLAPAAGLPPVAAHLTALDLRVSTPPPALALLAPKLLYSLLCAGRRCAERRREQAKQKVPAHQRFQIYGS